jgi:hypothetical protein
VWVEAVAECGHAGVEGAVDHDDPRRGQRRRVDPARELLQLTPFPPLGLPPHDLRTRLLDPVECFRDDLDRLDARRLVAAPCDL